MTIRDPELFLRALRAAAGVTGVLKRGAAIGVAAGALTLTGCGPSKTASSTPSNAGGGTTDPATATAADPDADAGVTTPDCADDPGYGSKCCTAALEANRSPIACTPWGPPAPPAYRGEALA